MVTTHTGPDNLRPRAEAIISAMHDLAAATFPNETDAAFAGLMSGIALGIALREREPEWAMVAYTELAEAHAEGMTGLDLPRTAEDHRQCDAEAVTAILALAREYAETDAFGDFLSATGEGRDGAEGARE